MSRAIRKSSPAVETEAPPASELVGTLIGAVQVLKRHVNTRLVEAGLPAHLSGARLRLCIAVEQAGRLRMGDVANALGITARTVTTLVDALEREGLLARVPDPHDRRATLLELTAQARTHCDKLHALQRELSEEVLAPLDPAEQRHLCQLLQRLRSNLAATAEHAAPDHAHAQCRGAMWGAAGPTSPPAPSPRGGEGV